MDDSDYRARAREIYGNAGAHTDSVDIDPDAVVSHGGDDGAYVAMWGWVPDEEEE